MSVSQDQDQAGLSAWFEKNFVGGLLEEGVEQ